MSDIPVYWEADADGSLLTSMRCGGSVTYLARPKTISELQETLALAASRALPIKLLGGGSNLILSDEGFSGVLVRPQFRWLRPVETDAWQNALDLLAAQTADGQRYRAEGTGYLALTDSQTGQGPLRLIEAGCDVAWGQLVQFSLQRHLHGLHRYARIPCKVGGAIYNNIHAAEHLLQEAVCAVQSLVPETGELLWHFQDRLDFGYDSSRFHLSGEVIVSALFALPEVSPPNSQADAVLYRDWTAQKAAVQPSGPNCGSVFKNLLAPAAGENQVAAGFYVEACGFKGRQVGGMQVYPEHANFIVNLGNGRQADLIELIAQIREAVRDRFSVELEPEAECIDTMGFVHQWEKSRSV